MVEHYETWHLGQIKFLLKLVESPKNMALAKGKSEGGSAKELRRKGFVVPYGKVGRSIRWKLTKQVDELDIKNLKELADIRTYQKNQSSDHLFKKHNAKLERDNRGRQILVTRRYNIPTKIGALLKAYEEKHILNSCYFCALENLEELENSEKDNITIELHNARLIDIQNLENELMEWGHAVSVDKSKQTKEDGAFDNDPHLTAPGVETKLGMYYAIITIAKDIQKLPN